MASNSKSQQTYWVVEKRQLLCLASARRQDIVDKLAAIGPMSIRQIASLVGASPASLYHHMEKLLAVGLIVSAGYRVVNRRREQVFATPRPRMRLMRALADPKNRTAMDRIGVSLSRQMQRDFYSGLRSNSARALGANRNVGFFRLVGAPGPKGMAQINKCFERVAEILWQSAGKKGELLALSWIMAPVDRKKSRPKKS